MPPKHCQQPYRPYVKRRIGFPHNALQENPIIRAPSQPRWFLGHHLLLVRRHRRPRKNRGQPRPPRARPHLRPSPHPALRHRAHSQRPVTPLHRTRHSAVIPSAVRSQRTCHTASSTTPPTLQLRETKAAVFAFLSVSPQLPGAHSGFSEATQPPPEVLARNRACLSFPLAS